MPKDIQITAAPMQSEKVAGIPFDDLFVDVELALVGDQVAGEDLLHHRQVLLRQRVVEAPFLVDARDQLRSRRSCRPSAAPGSELGITLKIRKTITETAKSTKTIPIRRRTMKRPIRPPSPPARRSRRGPRPATFDFGSRASRRPSPKTFSESTVSRIIVPGRIVSSGALEIRSKPIGDHRPPGGVGRLHAGAEEGEAPPRAACCWRC